MKGMIVCGVIFLLIIAFWLIFRKRLKPGEVNLIKLLVTVSLVVFVVFLIRYLKGNGDGYLFTDRHEGAPEVIQSEGKVVVIKIEGSTINIGSESYEDINDVSSLLYSAVSAGNSFKLIDSYAKASTYMGVKGLLIDYGVKDTDIEEQTEE